MALQFRGAHLCTKYLAWGAVGQRGACGRKGGGGGGRGKGPARDPSTLLLCLQTHSRPFISLRAPPASRPAFPAQAGPGHWGPRTRCLPVLSEPHLCPLPPLPQRMGPPGTLHSLPTSPEMSNGLTSVKHYSGEKKRKSFTFYSANVPRGAVGSLGKEKEGQSYAQRGHHTAGCGLLHARRGAGPGLLSLLRTGAAGGHILLNRPRQRGRGPWACHPGLPTRFLWDAG